MFKYTNEQLEKIDISLVKRWLAALESGEYKQTKEKLVSGNGQGFCCLGVVCKVEGSSKVRRDNLSSDNAFWFKQGYYWDDAYSVTDYPPSFIMEKLGIGELGSHRYGDMTVSKYATLNDERGFSFKQIAAILRADYAAAGLDLEGVPGG